MYSVIQSEHKILRLVIFKSFKLLTFWHIHHRLPDGCGSPAVGRRLKMFLGADTSAELALHSETGYGLD